MKEFSSSKESYVNRYIKKLLIEKYGASVIIKPMGTGKEDLITFEETAKGIMEDQFKDNIDRETTASRYNENPNDANNRMVDKVGQLIQEDISKLSQGNTYPSPQDLNNVDNLHSWLPESLERLLKILIPDDLKRTAIGHTILSASRRNFHSPLLFGVGVQLNHSSGPKWLNTHLSCLGFSVTYSQVRQYKKAVMESESLTPVIPPGSFVQWSADNVDHNCRTLDGKNTFHGMGIVASVTPNLSQQGISIERSKTCQNVNDLSARVSPPITEYIGKAVHPNSMKFKPYSLLKEVACLKKHRFSVLDFAWISNWLSKPSMPLRCNWSGYMQRAHSNETNFEKSSVLMLPLIDLSPSDPTCILSTLLFFRDKA